MSAMLKMAINNDLSKCKSDAEIDRIFLKYRMGFTNAVDASEFSHMISNTRMIVEHNRES